jgi:hypothetical protein
MNHLMANLTYWNYIKAMCPVVTTPMMIEDSLTGTKTTLLHRGREQSPLFDSPTNGETGRVCFGMTKDALVAHFLLGSLAFRRLVPCLLIGTLICTSTFSMALKILAEFAPGLASARVAAIYVKVLNGFRLLALRTELGYKWVSHVRLLFRRLWSESTPAQTVVDSLILRDGLSSSRRFA